jgi:hypothetical protein
MAAKGAGPGRRKSRRPGVEEQSRRRVVWGALAATMAITGTALGLLGGRPPASASGMSLPPLVAAAGPASIESVFRTRTAVSSGRWQAIVIHHSGSLSGTPEALDASARQGGLKGLGHHFVIGNGRGMSDGEIHVGYRWLDQLAGAHVAGVHGDWYNRNAVGICLVGDGRRRVFTEGQTARLVQLVGALMDELGIPRERVYLHSDLAGVEDPGPLFPLAAFHEQLPVAGRLVPGG